MIHCPYCGVKVNDDEVYCFKCGKKIPRDLEKRMSQKKHTFNRFWFIPTGLVFFFIMLMIGLYILSHNQLIEAKQLFEQGEEEIMNDQYEQAKEIFEDVLHMKPNFTQAAIALEFAKTALSIQKDIEQADENMASLEFQQALTIINESEHALRGYRGEAVTKLIDRLSVNRNNIKLVSVTKALEENPTIDDLKVLLWEAEAIKTEEATEVTELIRNQIVDYTHSKAMEQLNKHQFSDAQLFIDDGLKYASTSEKLLSLETTIKKEKETFETAQQKRIEQAIHLAEEERVMNEMEAVELKRVNVSWDDQGSLLVEGEVKSVGTIPINSVVVEYSLLDDSESEIITNKTFVFPDTLYPAEVGKFEFTHYDIDERLKNIDIQINKFTWYTE